MLLMECAITLKEKGLIVIRNDVHSNATASLTLQRLGTVCPLCGTRTNSITSTTSLRRDRYRVNSWKRHD